MGTNWTLHDAQEHFFIYVERTGRADLLHELRSTPIVRHPRIERLASTLYHNLKATAESASAPFFTALLGAQSGRIASIEHLQERAAKLGDRSALVSALSLVDDAGATIEHAFETLRVVQQRNLMPGAFQALLRQSTAMVWGAFETFSFDLHRLLFTSDVGLLRQVAAAQRKGTPWSDTPRQLLEWIEHQTNTTPLVTSEEAFDSFRRLSSMNLAATRHFCSVLFPSETPLLTYLNDPELGRLSARRHLLLHAAGVVDQKYIDKSGETLPIGSSLSVTPRELAVAFRTVSTTSAALARAADAVL